MGYLDTLRKTHADLTRSRRLLQDISAQSQRLLKQAIFSLQRNDAGAARKLLKEASDAISKGSRLVVRIPRISSEGMWRAALEEYCEAVFFERAATGSPLFAPISVTKDTEILIGALSDAVGEMVRLAVKSVIDGKVSEVARLYELAEETVGFILSLDLTGSLRSKVDQARSHLKRLDDIRYDVSQR